MTEAILAGFKDVENRDIRLEPTAKRPSRWIALHMSKSRPDRALSDALVRLAPALRSAPAHSPGFIVGLIYVERSVRLRDLRAESGAADLSPFASGPFCNVIARSIRLHEPVPCTGQVGAWVVPPAALEAVRRQLVTAPPPAVQENRASRGDPLPRGAQACRQWAALSASPDDIAAACATIASIGKRAAARGRSVDRTDRIDCDHRIDCNGRQKGRREMEGEPRIAGTGKRLGANPQTVQRDMEGECRRLRLRLRAKQPEPAGGAGRGGKKLVRKRSAATGGAERAERANGDLPPPARRRRAHRGTSPPDVKQPGPAGGAGRGGKPLVRKRSAATGGAERAERADGDPPPRAKRRRAHRGTSPPDVSGIDMAAAQLESLTWACLSALCKREGVAAGGAKAALIARLKP